MIIYSLSGHANDDWILAGDAYMASLLEPDRTNFPCVEIKVGDIIRPVENINHQQRISIIGHGEKGLYNHITANGFVNILKELGLNDNYTGIIEYFTCYSALFRTDPPIMHSLVHLTKNEFPQAIVIGAQGPSIIGPDNIRLTVNPDKLDIASQKQQDCIRNCNVDTTRPINGNILNIGKNIRDNQNVKNFYKQFINELVLNSCLINGVLVLN